jgi:hypothetical protein
MLYTPFGPRVLKGANFFMVRWICSSVMLVKSHAGFGQVALASSGSVSWRGLKKVSNSSLLLLSFVCEGVVGQRLVLVS